MSLESGTYISDLQSANPPGTDSWQQCDDHIKLIKDVILNTFPNIDAEVTATHTDLNKTSSIDSTRIIPVGSVTIHSINSAPAGWLLCDGTAVSRTTYSDLFDIVGTSFGVGDGSTTFNTPDLKGRTPAGYDSSDSDFDSIGNADGEITHTLTEAEVAGHTHNGTTASGNFDSHTHNLPLGLFGGGNFHGFQLDVASIDSALTVSSNNSTHSHPLSVNTAGSGTTHNNLQPFLTLAWIIKT